MTNFIIAQILSIINGIFLITSIRSKEKKKFLVQNSISNLAGFLSMIVLGAYSASIGPVILTIQGIITYIWRKEKEKATKMVANNVSTIKFNSRIINNNINIKYITNNIKYFS